MNKDKCRIYWRTLTGWHNCVLPKGHVGPHRCFHGEADGTLYRKVASAVAGGGENSRMIETGDVVVKKDGRKVIKAARLEKDCVLSGPDPDEGDLE